MSIVSDELLKLGGGVVVPLKQLLIKGNSNTVKDGNYTITYSADSTYYSASQNLQQAYHAIDGMYNDLFWVSSANSFPHWWQVDLGRVVNYIYKFCFNGTDDVVSIRVKDYELSYSLDGTNFNSIYSGTYVGKHKQPGVPSNQVWQTEECEFNPINARYFRITILNSYDTRGYKWAGLTNCLLYSLVNRCLILKESDNYIYDNILENKLITLEQWNSYTKEEKINLFETSFKFGVANLSKFKSFNNFKVFIKEDT